MKALMISAPCSNTGKTVLTLGLIRALTNRGMNISAFKTGPDYIDSSYQAFASKKPSGNLDIHLMGRDGLFESIWRKEADYAIIEGAMGYFDGSYNTYESSSYDIARTLDAATILVYYPKGEMFSAIPKIKGMVDFSKGRISGIIFNKTSRRLYEMLKPQVEEYVGIKVLGYIPEVDDLNIESRHLGLLMPHEIENFDDIVERAAKLCEEYIDIDSALELSREVRKHEVCRAKDIGVKIAIARDEAFGFCYSENLEIYEEFGEVNFFSPLNDSVLPDADVVIIGGGYPELYPERLQDNWKMRESIRNFAANGGYILGYGAGLLYLGKSLEGYSMCGVLGGSGRVTPSLQHFGYNYITLESGTVFGYEGDKLPAREFHRSVFESDDEAVLSVEKVMENKRWNDGYKYKNTFGMFSHFSAISWKKALEIMFTRAVESRGE